MKKRPPRLLCEVGASLCGYRHGDFLYLIGAELDVDFVLVMMEALTSFYDRLCGKYATKRRYWGHMWFIQHLMALWRCVGLFFAWRYKPRPLDYKTTTLWSVR